MRDKKIAKTIKAIVNTKGLSMEFARSIHETM